MIKYGCKEITFKKLEEGGRLVCDIKWYEPQWRKRLVEVDGKIETERFKDKGIKENEIVLLDTSNTLLMAKAKKLVEGDIVYVEYIFGRDKYNTQDWKVLDLIDKLDIFERQNKTVLFDKETITREAIIQPERKEKKKTNLKEKKPNKKDKEITDLKEKVVGLEGENAQLKSQLQLAIQLLQDKNNMTIEEVQELIGGDNYGTILL